MTFVSHAIVSAPAVGASGAGLRGRPLVWIDCDELGMWATELDGRFQLSSEDAFAHHTVVETICAAQACLPVRFGTVFGSAESVRSSIADRAADLRRALTRVEGKRELAVTLLWRSHERPLELREAPADLGPGARFMERRRAEYAAEDERKTRAAELAESLVAELAIERELVWHEICTSANVAVSLAALVPSERALDRKDEITRMIARFPDVVGVVNGPWPPYSFAGVR